MTKEHQDNAIHHWKQDVKRHEAYRDAKKEALNEVENMDNSDYKWVLFEMISALKAKSTYLKTIDASNKDFNKQYYDGMALAYHMVMDEVKSIAENFDLPLEAFSLDDYDPNEILEYKPQNYNEEE